MLSGQTRNVEAKLHLKQRIGAAVAAAKVFDCFAVSEDEDDVFAHSLKMRRLQLWMEYAQQQDGDEGEEEKAVAAESPEEAAAFDQMLASTMKLLDDASPTAGTFESALEMCSKKELKASLPMKGGRLAFNDITPIDAGALVRMQPQPSPWHCWQRRDAGTRQWVQKSTPWHRYWQMEISEKLKETAKTYRWNGWHEDQRRCLDRRKNSNSQSKSPLIRRRRST
jgi:hypothetical protein